MFHLRRLASIAAVSTSSRRTTTHPSSSSLLLLINKPSYLSTQSEESSNKQPVNLTDSCIKRLKEIKAADSKKRLRVLVDSGGCSGFEYKFSLDTEIKPDDILVGREGCEIVIDQASLPYLQGATVDHYEELIRTGFRVINNPNSEQGCSCGTSFSIKI